MADGRGGDVGSHLAALLPLADSVRRSLYLYVAAQPHDVSRQEAASATGMARNTAAFHLDRLVDAGLLEATYRRLTGRTGPGAGRPAKLYRPAAGDHAVSLPPRDYQRAAELLAEAADGADPAVRSRLSEAARAGGRRLGEEARSEMTGRAGRRRTLADLAAVLGRQGYQPYRQGSDLRLGNCPFDALTEHHRDLVCGMNLALLEGVVEGLGADDLTARLDPTPGQCCVLVGPAPSDGRRRRRPTEPEERQP